MAIDMIENNELGALSQSRLGSSNFVSEYKNYTGDDNFYNLFGSRNRKKSGYREDVQNLYKGMKTDCDSLATNIETINSDLETLVRRSGGRPTLELKEKIDETQTILGQMKSLQTKQQCLLNVAKQEKEQQSVQNIKTLTELSDLSVEKAKADLGQLNTETKGANMTMYYIIGGGVIVLGTIIYLMTNKK